MDLRGVGKAVKEEFEGVPVDSVFVEGKRVELLLLFFFVVLLLLGVLAAGKGTVHNGF